MFRKEYQGGTHVEVFSAQGRDPVARWKLSGTIKKEYNKQVKGYVYVMEGGSSTTRMQLPKNERTLLGLQQHYCVFQLLVPDDARFAVELSILDGGGSRRRVQLSSSLREISTSPLNARVPLTGMLTGQWVNLCVDMGSLVSGLFRSQSFKSLEAISVGGSCMLRRIFTLRGPPPDTVSPSEGTEGVEGIPRVYQMPGTSVAVETQVLTYASLSHPDRPLSEEKAAVPSNLPSSTRIAGESRPTHIAFGRKVAIPEHVLNSRQSTRTTSGSSTSARGRTAHSLQSPASPLSGHTPQQPLQEEVGLDGRGLQPRPPHHPADPSMLRIQRKRVRMISGREMERGGGSQDVSLPGSTADEGSAMTASSRQGQGGRQTESRDWSLLTGDSVAEDVSSSREEVALPCAQSSVEMLTARSLEMPMGSAGSPGLTAVEQSSEPPSSGIAGSDSGYRTGGSHTDVSHTDVERESEQLTSDEHLAVDVLQSVESRSSVAGPLSRATEAAVYLDEAGVNLNDSLPSPQPEDSFETELQQPSDSLLSESQCDTSLASEGMEEEGEEMYSYRSPPKSANRRQPNHGSSALAAPSRGARLDEDFLSPAEEGNEQGSPHEGETEWVSNGDASQLAQTRLSDDYDWRQYASTDGEDLDMSLRTRLAAHTHTPPTLLPAGSTDPAHSNSSEIESTLSGSMTLSGWTEQMRDAARNPLLDSLDTRGMGGTLSPTVGTLTEQSSLREAEGWRESAEDELELMYDPQLNCFYDPHTCKYYELAQ